MAEDEIGTAVVDAPDDLGGDTPVTDTPEPTSSATDQPAVAAPQQPESFINPADLPEEIKPHWKRMHAAYTKWIEQERNPSRADLDMLKKFRSDEGFATELLRYEAQRRGLNLAPVNGATPQAQAAPAGPTDGPPARLVEAIKARLDPSLHWMAEGMAAGQWAAAQEATRPLVEKDRAKELAARESEWGGLSAKLTETAPGWEAHESDMNALLDWVRSPALTHPQFGDKLSFLYNAVTGGSAANAQAIRAMGDAARNRTSTGLSGRAAIPNTTDRVMKATNRGDVLRIAAEEAEREMRARGMAVPD
jgi:hypothetical protein